MRHGTSSHCHSSLFGKTVRILLSAFGTPSKILYLGIGCTTLAFLLTNRSVTIIGPTRTSAFSGLTTVISVVSGVVFLHESFSLLQGLATALVLAGIYCVNILHSIYTARRQAAAEQKEQTV